MKKLATAFLLLAAPVLAAQEQITPEGPLPSLRGSWELGIYPTGRNVTTDIGRRNQWGHGFTGIVGYHFSDLASIEAAVITGWIQQVSRRTTGSLNMLSPSLSLTLGPWNDQKFAPYAVIGGSYDMYRFQRRSTNTDVRDLDYGSAHGGVGLRYRFAHNAAWRTEISSEFGQGSPTWNFFTGLSFNRGARRPTPAMRTVTQMRFDTVRVTQTRTDTVRLVQRDTVFRSEVILTLNDVNFDFDRATLRPEAGPLLDRAATELNGAAWAQIQIDVVGFTDAVGSEDYNLRLGMRRAKSVADYLVSRGVNTSRITILSGGEGHPVASNDTDQGRAQNRRVVIRRSTGR